MKNKNKLKLHQMLEKLSESHLRTIILGFYIIFRKLSSIYIGDTESTKCDMLTSFMICLSFKSCNLLVWFSSGSCKQVLPHRHMRCDTKHSLMWNLKSVNNYFLKAAQYWPQIRVSAVWCA